MTAPLLELANLRVAFPTPHGPAEVVKGVSFTLGRERLGIVGESGSGKSLTGRAILRLIRPPGRVSVDAHGLRRHRPRRACRSAPCATCAARASPW